MWIIAQIRQSILIIGILILAGVCVFPSLSAAQTLHLGKQNYAGQATTHDGTAFYAYAVPPQTNPIQGSPPGSGPFVPNNTCKAELGYFWCSGSVTDIPADTPNVQMSSSCDPISGRVSSVGNQSAVFVFVGGSPTYTGPNVVDNNTAMESNVTNNSSSNVTGQLNIVCRTD